jgi:O-antigen biosynthesis protein
MVAEQFSDKEYIAYLQTMYQSRGESYYSQFIYAPIPKNANVLDWGCGLGKMLEYINNKYPSSKLYGVDINSECVDLVKGNHPDWQIEKLAMPALRTPYPDSSFDRIFMLDVIEHVYEPDQLLLECYRLLKPKGVLTISTPDRLAFYKQEKGILKNIRFNFLRLVGKKWVDPTHKTEYTARSLKQILTASPFGSKSFKPSLWHQTIWARPLKKYYSFIVDLCK